MRLIIVGIIGVIFCIAFLIIDHIHTTKKFSNSVLEQTETEDFLDVIAKHKQRSLAAKPWSMSYSTYKTIAVIAAIIFAVLGYLITQKIIFALLLSTAGLLVPEIVIYLKATKSQTHYEERYATGLRQLVAGLKSGLSIQQAVSDVCVSPFVHDSIKEEFSQIDADLKLGISVQEAFQSFADRVRNKDAEDVAIAINMQMKVGGREAQVIESIAQNISNRIMLRKEINSMFAGSNMTVLAMDVVPFAVIAFMYFLAPNYLSPFFDNIVLTILFIVLLVFMGLGSIVIHRYVSRFRKGCGI